MLHFGFSCQLQCGNSKLQGSVKPVFLNSALLLPEKGKIYNLPLSMVISCEIVSASSCRVSPHLQNTNFLHYIIFGVAFLLLNRGVLPVTEKPLTGLLLRKLLFHCRLPKSITSLKCQSNTRLKIVIPIIFGCIVQIFDKQGPSL